MMQNKESVIGELHGEAELLDLEDESVCDQTYAQDDEVPEDLEEGSKTVN